MRVKVLSVRLTQKGKPLKAFVDVEISRWVVRDFRILKYDWRQMFVAPPQAIWKNPETNQLKFKPLFDIPSGEKQEIDAAVLTAYQKEVEKSHEKEQGSQR